MRRGVCPGHNALVHLLTLAGVAKMLTVYRAILEMNASCDSERASITGGVSRGTTTPVLAAACWILAVEGLCLTNSRS
jgi:hypothetical protein